MKRIQEQKLKMYEVVFALLSNTPAPILAQMPAITQSITTLGNNISTITTLAGKQIKNINGIALAKDKSRQELTKLALDINARVRSFAANNNKLVLLKEVKFTRAYLDKRSGNMLLIATNIIHTKALENLADLAPFGVTATTLTQLENAINNFNALLQKPRAGIVAKKVATANLKDSFTATSNLLTTQIDLSIGIIQNTEPELYNNYFNSRKVVKPIRIPLAILCTVLDTNNQPIPNVSITIKDSSRTFTTKTKGGFYAKSFPKGKHLFTFSKIGYNPKTITVLISNGKKPALKVVLSKTEPS